MKFDIIQEESYANCIACSSVRRDVIPVVRRRMKAKERKRMKRSVKRLLALVLAAALSLCLCAGPLSNTAWAATTYTTSQTNLGWNDGDTFVVNGSATYSFQSSGNKFVYYHITATQTTSAQGSTATISANGTITISNGNGQFVTSLPSGKNAWVMRVDYDDYGDEYYFEATTVDLSRTVTISGGGNAARSGGATSQTVSGAITTVTYTANTGYHFNAFSATTTNGITVTRTSDTTVTVSGTPTADTNVTVPNAVLASYSVTLNTNGGTIKSGNVTSYTYGTGATLPTNVTRGGYTFNGWYGNSGLTGSAVTSIPANATGNKTYYAKWTALPATAPTITGTTGTSLIYGYTSGSVSASATAPAGHTLSYQWYSNGSTNSNSGGTLISGATSASCPVPTGKSAGDYYFYCVVTAKRTDNNQTKSATSAPVKASVAVADISPTVSLNGWTYGSTANIPSVSGNIGNGQITYTYSGTDNDNKVYGPSTAMPTDAGSYTVEAAVAATSNTNSGQATKSFTISRADISPVVSLTGWTFGDTANVPSVTSGNPGGGAVTYQYKLKNAADGTYSAAVPTFAGSYTVKATVAQTPNYNGASATADFTIAKRSLTVTANAHTINYGDGAANNGVTYDNLAPGDSAASLGGTLAYAYSYTKGDAIGQYSITPGGLTSGNYTISYTSGVLTVSPKPLHRAMLSLSQDRFVNPQAEVGPEITMTDGDRTMGEADYTLSGDLTAGDFGTWFITIEGKGNYTGTLITSWELVNEDNAEATATDITASVHVKKDTPETTVDNLTVELAKTLLTNEEAERYENGEKVSVYLEVQAVNEEAVPDDDKTAIDEEMAKAKTTLGTYLNMTLWKKIGSDAAETISTTGEDIDVTVIVPKELRNIRANTERIFYIVRCHGGEAEVLKSTAREKITFSTDKFSTYALTYVDRYVPPVDWEGFKVKSPTTADPGVAIYGLLALTSTLGLAWMGKRKKD